MTDHFNEIIYLTDLEKKVGPEWKWRFIDRLIANASWLLKIVNCLQRGDGERIAFMLSGEWNPKTCNCRYCSEVESMLRRFKEATEIMESHDDLQCIESHGDFQ